MDPDTWCPLCAGPCLRLPLEGIVDRLLATAITEAWELDRARIEAEKLEERSEPS